MATTSRPQLGCVQTQSLAKARTSIPKYMNKGKVCAQQEVGRTEKILTFNIWIWMNNITKFYYKSHAHIEKTAFVNLILVRRRLFRIKKYFYFLFRERILWMKSVESGYELGSDLYPIVVSPVTVTVYSGPVPYNRSERLNPNPRRIRIRKYFKNASHWVHIIYHKKIQ